jgi:hypothetical protein
MPKRSSKAESQSLQPNVGEEIGTKSQWLTVAYQPVSLFSLKRSDATSMAARSNLVPTPYAIKMALLKVLLEQVGRDHRMDFDRWVQPEFEWIRGLQIYVQPPERLVVNRNGYKLRYYDQTIDKADKSRRALPMQDGFVFREWVCLEGDLQLCIGPSDRLTTLQQLCAQITYFGKRGCFFQYLADQTQITAEPQFQPDPTRSFILQPMDDLGAKTSFNRINPYAADKAQLGKDRLVNPGFLPLKLTATGARYDFYERV